MAVSPLPQSSQLQSGSTPAQLTLPTQKSRRSSSHTAGNTIGNLTQRLSALVLRRPSSILSTENTPLLKDRAHSLDSLLEHSEYGGTYRKGPAYNDNDSDVFGPATKPPADKPPADKPPADKPPADKPPAETRIRKIFNTRESRAPTNPTTSPSTRDAIFAPVTFSRNHYGMRSASITSPTGSTVTVTQTPTTTTTPPSVTYSATNEEGLIKETETLL